MNRFKIDFYVSSHLPYGLYIERRGLFKSKWELVDRFETRENAKEYHEKIKDLPEYLE